LIILTVFVGLPKHLRANTAATLYKKPRIFRDTQSRAWFSSGLRFWGARRRRFAHTKNWFFFWIGDQIRKEFL